VTHPAWRAKKSKTLAIAGALFTLIPFMKLKRQSLVSQGSLSRMLQAARTAWERKDFSQVIEILERASRLDPANVSLLLDLGGAYGKRFDYTAAERYFEKAVRIAPKKSDTLVVAGQRSRDFFNYQMAENYFRRALEQKDASPETIVKLAELYERLRRLAEATDLVERALQLDSTCVSALLLYAKLNRQAGRLDEAQKRIQSLPANIEPHFQARAAYEAGGILDRQGHYDEAMAAFLKAKALLRPQAERPAAELNIIRTRIKDLAANASADVLQQWFNSITQLQPSNRLVLLGGHPRSGTTLLEQVVDAHPDIISADETEIFYDEAYAPLLRGLPDDTAMYSALTTASVEALKQARQNYFRSVELSIGKPIGERLLIDKNPSYTFLIPAFIRIFPETKFLIALRDPRDVILSCFMQDLPLNHASAAWLTLAGATEEYSNLMTIWQTVKTQMRNPYLEIRYEDMVDDLETVARRTLNFLDVPWDERVLGFDAHARQKAVRSPTYADVTKPVFKTAVGRWRNYQKYLEPHLEKLEPFVKAFGYE
jgi:tetratricopeptide (TPR) repeat protein